MELKCDRVLIISFWNSSNRTFMELKFGREMWMLASSGCSNRTFMELKLLINWDNRRYATGVLIVPLWN